MSDYPQANIPTDPVLCVATFGSNRDSGVRSVLDAGNVRHVTSGRVAIGLALLEMRVDAGDEVLIPAYHSRSMVEPVIWAGAQPVFFKVRADTSLDLDDLAAKMTPRSKVVMVPNYFGFPQNLAGIREFCDRRGLLMLEDCAHAFFGEHAGRPLGSFGDYAIASTMKFLPVYDGGCLVSARHDLRHVPLRSAGAKFEIKTALNTLERAFVYARMQPLAHLLALPLAIKDRLWGAIKRQDTISGDAVGQIPAGAAALGPKSADGAFGFETAWLDKRSSMVSRLVTRHASRRRIVACRRANYLHLQAQLEDLPGCRALYATLPAGTVPWLFPLLADNPTQVFPMLKNAGVPVVRFAEFLWDGVDESVCAVSIDLSRRVLQLPVHQELRPAELDWMVGMVRTIFQAAAREPVGA